MQTEAEMVVNKDFGHHQRVALELKFPVLDIDRVNVPARIVGQRHQENLLVVVLLGYGAMNTAYTTGRNGRLVTTSGKRNGHNGHDAQKQYLLHLR